MIAPERTLLVLLAAGRSDRFGAADKLAADWRGKPLALHAVAALAELPFMARVAVTSSTTVDFAAHGYRTLINPAPDQGLSGSLALGVRAAQEAGAAALLVALADMPCITAAHVMRLLAAADGPAAVIASSDGVRPSPPALFATGCFATLSVASGDAGGRALIRDGIHIVTDAAELIDIDTPEDLERLNAIDVLKLK